MRVLVTGGTGFIGSNLARELSGKGHQVLVTGLENNSLTHPQITNLGKSFHDLSWNKIGNLDILFHQAANNDTTSEDKEEMFKVNFEWPQKLFQKAVENGCRRIVYASSTAIYGNISAPYKEDGPVDPLNVYAESKLAFDEFATGFAKKNPKVIVVGLRYCNIYGPGENKKGKRATMIYQLAQEMKKGDPYLFKYGEQKRDYLYVKDVVRANLLATEARKSCIVNCGYGEATTFNRLVEILNSVLALGRTPQYIDNPYKKQYQNHTECDMSLAKKEIGFIPEFNILKGIEDYFKSGFLTQE